MHKHAKDLLQIVQMRPHNLSLAAYARRFQDLLSVVQHLGRIFLKFKKLSFLNKAIICSKRGPFSDVCKLLTFIPDLVGDLSGLQTCIDYLTCKDSCVIS